MLVILSAMKDDRIQFLEEDECLNDFPFIWTGDVNDWMINNGWWNDFVIVQTSVGIDFMMLSYLVIFFVWSGTLRVSAALILLYPVRNVI